MPRTFRGKAVVEGVTNAVDVILYPLMQSMKLSQEFDEEIIKDEHGDDAAWIARNEKYMGELGMKIVGDTVAHAETGAAFLAPLAVVTISTCKVTAWNTTHQIVPGSSIETNHEKVGDISFKLRRYANSTQNTLAATTPI